MKTAIYSRVSSAAQTEGYSMEAQYEQMIKYIDTHNYDLVKTYSDPGISAKDLNRPGIQELLVDLKAGKFECLVIHKLDRLTRNAVDLCNFVELVIKHDVKLISLSENLETNTPMGLMMIRMLGVLAQMFRENLSQEIVKGQSMRASKGLRVSAARPYGYNLGENLAMSVNEEEAYIIRLIFDWFNEGYNILTIVSKINELGITKNFTNVTVSRILCNPTYIGVNHWKRKGAKEGIYFENAHEPIVSEEVFQNAQDILLKRKEHFLSQSMSDFCFSTVVKCGVCGRSIIGRVRREKQTSGKMWEGRAYRCAGKDRFGCKVGSISENRLTALFLDFISNYSIKYNEPQKVIAGRDLTKDRKRLEKLINDSSNVKKNYLRAYGSGKIDFDLFTELAAEEDKKLEEWKTELDTINQMSPSDKKTRKDILAKLENLKSGWNGLSALERKMDISDIFKFIVIRPENGEWKIVAFKTHE